MKESERVFCMAGQTLHYPYGEFSASSCVSHFPSPSLDGVALHSKGQTLSDAIIEKFNACRGQFIEMNPQTSSCFLRPLYRIFHSWSCFMATIRRVIENPWLIDSDPWWLIFLHLWGSKTTTHICSVWWLLMLCWGSIEMVSVSFPLGWLICTWF